MLLDEGLLLHLLSPASRGVVSPRLESEVRTSQVNQADPEHKATIHVPIAGGKQRKYFTLEAPVSCRAAEVLHIAITDPDYNDVLSWASYHARDTPFYP